MTQLFQFSLELAKHSQCFRFLSYISTQPPEAPHLSADVRSDRLATNGDSGPIYSISRTNPQGGGDAYGSIQALRGTSGTLPAGTTAGVGLERIRVRHACARAISL